MDLYSQTLQTVKLPVPAPNLDGTIQLFEERWINGGAHRRNRGALPRGTGPPPGFQTINRLTEPTHHREGV